MKGSVMQKELSEFIASERNRLDSIHNNMFAYSFAEVERYYNFLEIIYDRHISDLIDYHNAFNELNRSMIGHPDRQKMNEEQMTFFGTLQDASVVVQLDIESFYLFSKIYLDKIARAIEFYFGKINKLSLDSHDDFVKCIRAYCKAKDLTLHEGLLSLADKLKKDISDFRDYQIAHLKSPRTYRGTTGDGRMQLLQIYPTEKDEQKETKLLDSLLSEIEGYTELIIAFIIDNKEKTTLRLKKALP